MSRFLSPKKIIICLAKLYRKLVLKNEAPINEENFQNSKPLWKQIEYNIVYIHYTVQYTSRAYLQFITNLYTLTTSVLSLQLLSP